ncbi:MAG: TIGR02266 family protein [Deltaproteobacteria bacterium]|nr:TIGR02266 family protein [Deltaproteobacteria bacterium]
MTDERKEVPEMPPVLHTQRGRERRLSHRLPVDLAVGYRFDNALLFTVLGDLSDTGTFVRTRLPERVGTRLELEFCLPGEAQPVLTRGEVVWSKPFPPGAKGITNPGMGVRFTQLDQVTRAKLQSLIHQRA